MSIRPFSRNYNRYAAFTLVELLVVIAIIGILIALLVPAVQAIRATARATQCRSNLRQMAVAATSYESSKQRFPPGMVHNDFDFRTGSHSGFTFLLPYIEQNPVYDSYDFNIDWDQGTNLVVIQTNIPMLRCPSSPSSVIQNGGIEAGPTDYAMCKGDRAYMCFDATNSTGVFDINSRTTNSSIQDGLSNTFMYGEAASDPNIPAAST